MIALFPSPLLLCEVYGTLPDDLMLHLLLGSLVVLEFDCSLVKVLDLSPQLFHTLPESPILLHVGDELGKDLRAAAGMAHLHCCSLLALVAPVEVNKLPHKNLASVDISFEHLSCEFALLRAPVIAIP
jgi:hypothetical protein